MSSDRGRDRTRRAPGRVGGRVGGDALDDLARRAGLPTTTVRLYQHKGLLPGPRLVGRTGRYDESHLSRLALIGRLQDEAGHRFPAAAAGRRGHSRGSTGSLSRASTPRTHSCTR
ncbi:MAG: MerR family transcriptional regulator [Acidimicrobiales bacterium]